MKAWHRAEKGMPPEQPAERIYVKDVKTLLRFLTPRRREALNAVYDQGPTSVRALAKVLGRDYKNVHKDMQEMEKIGRLFVIRRGFCSCPGTASWPSFPSQPDAASREPGR